jgi:hypothetical protein
LRDSNSRGRRGELQGFTKSQKVSQMSEFHCPSSLCRESMAAQGTWYWADSKQR